mgnify:FL=1
MLFRSRLKKKEVDAVELKGRRGAAAGGVGLDVGVRKYREKEDRIGSVLEC